MRPTEGFSAVNHTACLTVLACILITGFSSAAENRYTAKLLAAVPAVAADYGGGRQVTGAEVRAILRPQIQAMLARGQEIDPAEVATWAAQITEGIVDQKLLLDEALKEGCIVDPNIGKQLVEEQRQRFGDENFSTLLTLQGVSEADFALRLAENQAVEQWLKTVLAPRHPVTDAEVKAYYEAHREDFPRIGEYRVSHILFAATLETSYDDLLKLQNAAAAVRQAALTGGDFEALAKKHSSCPSSADGGDLGFLSIGSMPEAFETAALALEPGAISPVIRSTLGYHVIRGNEVKPSGILAFAEVRETLAATLARRAVDQAMNATLTRLREQAGVRIYATAP